MSADNLCAAKDIPKGTVWNMGCIKVPLFGNIVKIESSSSILALCEVEVYAEPYGKKTRITGIHSEPAHSLAIK